MRKHLLATTLTLSIAAALPGTALIPSAHAQAAPPAAMVSPNRYGLPDFGDLVEQVGPAVVNISVVQRAAQGTTAENPMANDPFYDFLRRFGVPMPGFPGQPGMGPRARQGIGSGFIVSPDGYVLTNNHVIETADAIEIALNDGRKFAAKLIGRDPETDLAVLRIASDAVLPAITFSATDSLAVGDVVLAIGNPFGVGQTVTMGIVSALGRSQLGINTFENYIQTDAAINPGNSGGALVDSAGHLVGINTAIYSRSGGSLGIGFAIPVSIARSVLEQIVATGEVVRGWVGVEIQDLTPELAESFGYRDAVGALIAGVLRGSPADRGGVRPGDVLIALDGQSVRDPRAMLDMVAALPPGKSAVFRVRRGAEELDLTVDVGRRPIPAANR